GKSIFDIPLVNWRNKLGYVMQGNMLMNDTIKENLLYGTHETVDDQRILKYAQLANCHSFINSLKEGYNSMVGENGVKLSGGERQRIDIARNFIKNTDILLIDEATANLDSHSEQIILEAISIISKNRTFTVIAYRFYTIYNALNFIKNTEILLHEEVIANLYIQSEHIIQEKISKISKNRTTLVISHRLSTIKNADKIIFLDKGRITGIGTHTKLINSHEKY